MISVPSSVAFTTLGVHDDGAAAVAGGRKADAAGGGGGPGLRVDLAGVDDGRQIERAVRGLVGRARGIVPAHADAVQLGDGGDLRPAGLRLRRGIGGQAARVQARPQPGQQVGDDAREPVGVQLVQTRLGVGPDLLDVARSSVAVGMS